MAFSNEAKSIPKQWEGLFGTETATGSALTKQIPMTAQRVAILELSKQ